MCFFDRFDVSEVIETDVRFLLEENRFLSGFIHLIRTETEFNKNAMNHISTKLFSSKFLDEGIVGQKTIPIAIDLKYLPLTKSYENICDNFRITYYLKLEVKNMELKTYFKYYVIYFDK